MQPKRCFRFLAAPLCQQHYAWYQFEPLATGVNIHVASGILSLDSRWRCRKPALPPQHTSGYGRAILPGGPRIVVPAAHRGQLGASATPQNQRFRQSFERPSNYLWLTLDHRTHAGFADLCSRLLSVSRDIWTHAVNPV